MLWTFVAAMLVPFPHRAVGGLAVSLVFWLVFFAALASVYAILRCLARLWGPPGATVRLVATGISTPTLLLLLVATGAVLVLIVANTTGLEVDMFAVFVVGVTPMNLAGPVNLLRRWRPLSGAPLLHRATSGEVLWAWDGLGWPMVMANWNPHDAVGLIKLMSESARLSAAVALMLSMHGRPPAARDEILPHCVGWFLLALDNIIYGWYASAWA